MMTNEEPTLDELLREPIIRLVMVRDGIDFRGQGHDGAGQISVESRLHSDRIASTRLQSVPQHNHPGCLIDDFELNGTIIAQSRTVSAEQTWSMRSFQAEFAGRPLQEAYRSGERRHKQTWANIRKISDAPAYVKQMTYKSKEYLPT